jgi:segregation and condensation protein B
LVVITGRNENMVGKPLVYATSKHFMDYFGINSSTDLPKISEVLAEQIVQPTLVNAEHFNLENEPDEIQDAAKSLDSNLSLPNENSQAE